jgi:hypothetical protein
MKPPHWLSCQQVSNVLCHGKYLYNNRIANFAHFIYTFFYKEKVPYSIFNSGPLKKYIVLARANNVSENESYCTMSHLRVAKTMKPKISMMNNSIFCVILLCVSGITLLRILLICCLII